MRVESNGGPARSVAWRRALRLAAGHLLAIGAGLALIGLAGEAWLCLTAPFMSRNLPLRFVPGVGLLIEPHTEVHWTNRLDFWTITRTDRLGFPDRPLPPERAATGCRVAVIGDSMTEAIQLPIAGKFHVLLEELAAQRLPRLAVTTVAFGKGGTGQINQLPFHDEYARRLNPRLVVLVFTPNDRAARLRRRPGYAALLDGSRRRWAAEALLEHLAAHPDVCDAPAAARSVSPPAHATRAAGRGWAPMPAIAGFQPAATRSALDRK